MAKDEPFSSKLCLLPARTGGFSSSMITLSSDEQELSVQKNIVQRVRQELRQGRASSWSLVVVVVVVWWWWWSCFSALYLCVRENLRKCSLDDDGDLRVVTGVSGNHNHSHQHFSPPYCLLRLIEGPAWGAL